MAMERERERERENRKKIDKNPANSLKILGYHIKCLAITYLIKHRRYFGRL
jgi:hypothetical protein